MVDSITAGPSEEPGFAARVTMHAPPPLVFAALTSLEGLAGWWASLATGSASSGGRFELGFTGLEESITMRVDRAVAPSDVAWTCVRHTGLPDWDGTRIVFALEGEGTASTTLAFRHLGLIPDLGCYEHCRAGWQHFLSSLRSYAEQGRGTPFAGDRR
jgi:uncharacterized protein YndB with AHSA1/START domain